MRQITFVALLLLSSFPAVAHRDRHENPDTLTISFSSGVIATFTLTDARDPQVTGIRIHVGSHDYFVPPEECAKLRDIHFQTIKFVFNSSYNSPEEADYFLLEFDMGAPNTKSFGAYPHVEVTFRNREYWGLMVTLKITASSWQDSKL